MNAAPRGEAAFSTWPENPLLTLPTRDNLLEVEVDGMPVRALVDTGATISVISAKLCSRLHKVLTPALSHVKVADGGTPTISGMCTARVTIAGRTVPVLFAVLQNCPYDVILGLDFLSDHSALIDCSTGFLSLELPSMPLTDDTLPPRLCSATHIRLVPQAITYVSLTTPRPLADGVYVISPITDVLLTRNVTLPHTVATIIDSTLSLPVLNFGLHAQVLPKGMSLATVCPIQDYDISTFAVTTTPDCDHMLTAAPDSPDKFMAMLSPDLSKEQARDLHRLLLTYSDIFDFPNRPLGRTSAVKHRIDTGDSRPIYRRPYRVSHAERAVIQREVDEMLKKDIIEPSCSPWASPVVLVKKKDGTWRFCVDYRHLNKITKKDVYPLPRIDDALDCLYGAQYFSSIDLRSGYWQISIDDLDKEKTAFITPDGLYQFKVMPFGLCNAPATFERMMDSLLRGFKWSTCLCYLDDVIVFSSSFAAHLTHLSDILALFRQAGLQLNSSKCHFGQRRIKILGHLVDAQGVQPDPDKVKAVKHFPVPRSTADVRSFVGLCSYFRRFIKGFADIARPLTDLLKKDATFSWGPEQAAAFATLISRLTSSPVLAHFDVSAPTEVRTDASGHGIGAILSQRQAGCDRVIAYASRLLSASERNYSITERECLALVWAVAKFRPYLYGRPFSVITDHHALCWLASLKDPTGRLGRWALRLQDYSYSVIYKSGRLHQDADCLSRYPVDPPDTVPATKHCILSLSDFPNIGNEQRRDASLRSIIETLISTPHARSARMFQLKDGILYRRNLRPDGPELLLAIPEHLRLDVLQQLHDLTTAGHLGVSRTYDRIRRRFFWPGLYRSVRQYVRSCDLCQRRKTPNTYPAGLLQPLDIPSEPFFRVGLDLLGPFPQSTSGNKWIAVATDYATRYAITRALPTSCATDVADFLLHDVILLHGAPRQLLTDRGRSFLSQVIADILRSCSTQHKLTTAYHPQTNGLTERLNRTITDMLSMYVSADHRDWDVALPYVTFAYNSSRHDTAGYSPFYLLFGREPALPLDTVLPAPVFTSDYARTAIARADHARQVARARLCSSQVSQKSLYDSRHQARQFTPGSLVLLWSPSRRVGLCEKLLSRYSGPYRILREVTPVTYEIAPLQPHQSTHMLTDVVHVSRLKPYRQRISAPGS